MLYLLLNKTVYREHRYQVKLCYFVAVCTSTLR